MRQLVEKIPIHVRRDILLENNITEATPYSSNYHMKILINVWRQYIESTVDLSCQLCYNRVLKNWQEMLPIMIELEKEYQLLNEA